MLVSLLVVLLVLMQRPKSEGLGAAFGGGMTENLFGAQTTNVLQKATRWLGGIFLGVALILCMLYSRQGRVGSQQSAIQKQLTNAPVPKQSGTDAAGNPVPTTEDAIKKLLTEKIKEAQAKQAAASASPSNNASPAPANGASPVPSPAGKPKDDLPAPALQLQTVPPGGTGGTSGDLEAPKLQLQTGTGTRTDKKDGF